MAPKQQQQTHWRYTTRTCQPYQVSPQVASAASPAPACPHMGGQNLNGRGPRTAVNRAQDRIARSDCKIGLQGTTVVSTRETWMPPTTPRRTAPNVGQPLHHPVCASTVGHRATCCTSKEEEKKREKSVWSAACCRSDPLRRAWYAPCVARHETE